MLGVNSSLGPKCNRPISSPTRSSPPVMSALSCCLAQDTLDPLESLANNIPGVAGQDYPIFAFPPDTGLACEGKVGA